MTTRSTWPGVRSSGPAALPTSTPATPARVRGRPAGSRAGGDAADRPGSRVRADAALTLSGVDDPRRGGHRPGGRVVPEQSVPHRRAGVGQPADGPHGGGERHGIPTTSSPRLPSPRPSMTPRPRAAPSRAPRTSPTSTRSSGTGEKEGQAGAALRRGRFSAIVLAQAGAGAAAGSRGRRGRPDPPTRRQASRRGQRSVPVPVAAVHLRRPGRDVRRRHRGGAGIGRRGSRPRLDTAPVRRSAGCRRCVAAPAGVVSLDAGASDLRRRGIVVVAAQLIALNVIVISLAGDFAWRGVAVAVLGLAGGLGFTSWWRRKELGALGPKGSGTPFILPRPAGALVGSSLAVLGVGVSYALKGIRYLLLKPSLAQLRWSNLLGLSPRARRGLRHRRPDRGHHRRHPVPRRPRSAGRTPDGFSPSTTGRRCCTCARSGTTRCRWPPSPRRGGPSSSCSRSGAGPVRGGGRLGVRHLRTRRRGGPAGSVAWPRWVRHAKHLSDDTWQEQVAMRMHDARVQSSSPPGDPACAGRCRRW